LLCFQNQNIVKYFPYQIEKEKKKKKKKVGIYPLLPTNSKTISCKVFSSDSSTQQQNNKQTLALILKKIN
jgi:hypothetical protein